MRITSIRIKKNNNPENKVLLGVASVEFDNCLVIHDLQLIQLQDKRIVSFPHKKAKKYILKEVQKYQDDPKNYVLCKSHNDKYPEEELPKSMISSVWKVVKILNERGW